MRCAVRGCKSKSSDVTTQYTFHRFPVDPDIRKQWMMNTGIDVVTKDLMICSLHFEPSCFRYNRNRKLLTKYAVPTIFVVVFGASICRACLATDCKMFPLTEEKLMWYENLTGLDLKQHSDLPKWLCFECHHQLINVNRFRNKSLNAHKMLLDVLDIHDVVDISTIKTVDREANNLVSSLQIHTDLQLVELQDEYSRDDSKPAQDNECSQEVNFIHSNTFLDEVTKDDDDDEPMKYDDEVMDIDDDEENKEYDEIRNDNCDENDYAVVYQPISDENVKYLVIDLKSDEMRQGSEFDEILSHVKKIENRMSKKKNITPDKEVDGFTITSLSFEEQIEEMEKRKESTHYKKTQYHCDICHSSLMGRVSLELHMKKHTRKGNIICAVCKLIFKTQEDALHHLTHNHLYKYSCSHCSFVTNYRSRAMAHNSYHKGRQHKCPHCPEIFSLSETLCRHIHKKHPTANHTEYFCELCGRKYTQKRSIFVHKQKHHLNDSQKVPEDGPFCEICDVRFLNEEAYNNHMKCSFKHETDEVTSVVQKPQAEKKGKKTVYYWNPKLDYYKKCLKCDKQYSNKQCYNRHIQSHHPEDYVARIRMSREMKVKLGYPLKGSIPRLMCDQCGKRFRCRRLLEEHVSNHTGIYLYKCDQCGKSFKTNRMFKEHEMKHKGQYFVCDVCDRRFTRCYNLDKHRLLHSGARPHKCDICDKTFVEKARLKLHIDHVHRNVPWPTRKRQKTENTKKRKRVAVVADLPKCPKIKELLKQIDIKET